jgi:hypothetical protein
MDHSKRITFAETSETFRRAREVQLLVNIVQPDPDAVRRCAALAGSFAQRHLTLRQTARQVQYQSKVARRARWRWQCFSIT